MFKLTIRTPYEEIFNGEAKSITFASEDGEMQILEDHASITATMAFSPIVVEEEDKDETYLARNGIFIFDNENNSASMLTSYCEKKSQVDYKSVQEYADFIAKMLEEGHELSEFQLVYLQGEKVAIQQQIEEIEK